jgi:putative transposase
MQCKYCGETKTVVRYGRYKNIQRFYCRECRKKFTAIDSIVGMRTPVVQIALVLSMFYDGFSPNVIKRNLQQIYGIYPSDSTIYNWIIRFTKKASSLVQNYKANSGETWIIDESTFHVKGQKFHLWDVIDKNTGFLLATHVSMSRTAADVECVLNKTVSHSIQIPKVIISNKLQALFDGVENVFGASVKHVVAEGIESNGNPLRTFHKTIEERTKTVANLRKQNVINLIVNGWLINYNFLRPCDEKRGLTPAHMAYVNIPNLDGADINWMNIIRN